MTNFDILSEARHIFDIEIEALSKTRDSLGEDFTNLIQLIMDCEGKVIVTGMGKPGHIAGKIAATLASLGTPAFHLHPAEAMHGDLGMVEKKDIIILMSYSGESEEVTRLIPTLDEIGCQTIAITGKPNSTLAQMCRHHFFFPEFEEACHMHLAPTSSTTALLALGDALAVVLSKLKGYTKYDFSLRHPAGALGKRLLTRVHNIMRSGEDNAVVSQGSALHIAILEMSHKAISMVSVVDSDYHPVGIITDGDLRRMLEKGINVYDVAVDDVMTHHPKTIGENDMAVYALQTMTNRKITGMPVIDNDGKLIGGILMQDIIKAGII